MAVTSSQFKVMAFSPLYAPFIGGIETLLGTILPAFRASGIVTVVVTESADGLAQTEFIDGIRVYRLPLSRAIRSRVALEPLKVVDQLRGIISAEKPDALHLHSVAQSASFYVDKALSNVAATIPLLISLHGALEQDDLLQVVVRLLSRARAVSGVSRACLTSADQFISAECPRDIIYNGISKTDLRCSDWHSGETARLLCVGRLQLEKGYDLAIAALAKARQQGFNGQLTIIGRGEQGHYFQKLAADLGISNYVFFLGEMRPDLAKFEMARSHAILAPSRTREGFGLVVGEAGAMGMPAIVSDVGGLPEVVLDGLSGIVIPREDPAALTEAILHVFKNEVQWREMGCKARERISSSFSISNCVNGYLKFFDEHVRSKKYAL